MKLLVYKIVLLAEASVVLGNGGLRRPTNQLEGREHPAITTRNDDEAARAIKACNMAETLFGTPSKAPEDTPVYMDARSNPSQYVTSVQVKWSDNCWQNSSCILSPTNTQDLAQIMSIVSSTRTKFSVRSGGHDFNPNHSDVNGSGLLIDLVNINTVSLSDDKSTVTVGTGSLWGAVYKTLNGTGVSVNGGRSPNPGIGGQTLGGGSGWFTDSDGVTAARVTAAEVVLGNGTIVQATEEENSDLLWALRGGGSNFGVVAHLTYKTLPIDKVWYAQWKYGHGKNQQLLNALVEYHALAADEPKASLVFSLSMDPKTNSSFVGFFYSELKEFPSVFAPFYDIEPDEIAVDSTFGTLADLAYTYYIPQYPEPGIPAARQYAATTPHKIDNGTFQVSYASFQSHARKALSSGWVMNYGSQAITKVGVEASSNTPLGLEPVYQDWVHVTLSWTSPADDVAAKRLLQELSDDIINISSRHNSKIAYRFMNDAYEGQNVFGSYGAKNVAKLKQISQKYDHDGVFQELQNGGWLLSRS